jgi:hypothetical protein
MKLTITGLKKLIREELSGLIEMDSNPTTYSDVYPGPIGKIFDMIISSDRGEPSHYETRIQILQLIDSLGEQFIKEMLETLKVEIRNQYSYSLSMDKNNSNHEASEPRFKLMELQSDIEQMLEKGPEAVFKELSSKATDSEDPNWLDI